MVENGQVLSPEGTSPVWSELRGEDLGFYSEGGLNTWMSKPPWANPGCGVTSDVGSSGVSKLSEQVYKF
jgi:hypothetical protein